MPSQVMSWDHSDPITGHSIPAAYFHDAQVFEEEKQNIFMTCWHVVGHVNEFKERGAFIVQDIFEQSVLVMSHKDGKIRAFHNAWRHRGNRLLTARRGKIPAVLRCGYHSWFCGPDGALRAAPRTECLKDFDKALYGLSARAFRDICRLCLCDTR